LSCLKIVAALAAELAVIGSDGCGGVPQVDSCLFEDEGLLMWER